MKKSHLCLVFVMLSCLFITALWSPAGKGLTSWLLFVMFNCVFVIFPFGILGQMWRLIVQISDFCRIFTFHKTLTATLHQEENLNEATRSLSSLAVHSKVVVRCPLLFLMCVSVLYLVIVLL